jgi:hypothetical protein
MSRLQFSESNLFRLQVLFEFCFPFLASGIGPRLKVVLVLVMLLKAQLQVFYL